MLSKVTKANGNGKSKTPVAKTNRRRRRQRQTSSAPTTTVAPLAVATPWRSKGNPQFGANGRGVIVAHDEVFTEVIPTGTTLNTFSFPVNPGVGTIFPWLSQVAARFDTYKFRRLAFEFRTNQPATAGGIVCLAYEADCNDPAPTTMFQAESYHDAVSDVVWKPTRLMIDLNQDDRLPTRKTRVGLPATNYDLSNYDAGTLYCLTEGVAAGTVGRLVVHYVVELFTHQIQDPVAGNFTSSAGMDSTHLFGTTRTVDTDSCLPFTVTSTGTGFLFNQFFEGMIAIKTTGTVMSADIVPTVTGSAASLCVSNGSYTQTVNAASTAVAALFRVRAYPGTLVTFAMTATTVTATYVAVAAASYTQV